MDEKALDSNQLEPTVQQVRERTLALLEQAGIEYKEVTHAPVFSYEDAEKVREEHNLTGTESKSLFIRLKDGRFCMYVTTEGQRADLKLVKKVLGSKPSVCSDEELTEQTGCLPKCACPFGHKPEISLIVDTRILECDRFIFSSGPPEKTIEIAASDLEKILAVTTNPIIRIAPE
jgi:Ala-tRNA(Pro) deacylase